jgi:hypothetical protein
MKKQYELNLHYKQGDDLGDHIESTLSPSEAFLSWGSTFKRNEKVCLVISEAIKDVNVCIEAGMHMIQFTPIGQAAEAILAKLANDGFLYEVSIDEDYEEEELLNG